LTDPRPVSTTTTGEIPWLTVILLTMATLLAFVTKTRRKAPGFSYGDIRRGQGTHSQVGGGSMSQSARKNSLAFAANPLRMRWAYGII